MKKIYVTALFMALTLAFTGCAESGASSRGAVQTTGIRDVLQSGIASEKEKTSETAETTETVATDATADTDATTQTAVTIEPPKPEDFAEIGETFKGTKGIDIDLTKGNANMVYAQVYNIMYAPEEFIGKKIKMQGEFTMYHDEATGKYYYACFIADAAKCCTQGIEFIPAKKVKYPDDFPKVGTKILVTGVFTTYKEGSETYAALKDAAFKVI